jgi:hypothetical protein
LSQLPPPTPEYIAWAWGAGELAYRLRNLQKKILEDWQLASTKFLKFYIECTRRMGKSTWGLLWLSEDCIKNPGSRSAFFAPVEKGLQDYIGDFDKPDTPLGSAFMDCPIDLRPVLDSTMTLTFPNGSQIIFRGSNNKQHRVRRGNAFRRVFIDEGRDVDELDTLVDSVVVPSLFSVDGRVVISSTPADTDDHPLFAIKQAAELEGWYSHYDIYDAHRYDPVDFPIDRIEKWKKETTNKVAWDREYMARWVKDPTKVAIPEWDDSKNILPGRDEFFPYYHKYAALDSGVTDKTAGLLAYYDFKRAVLVVEDEFALQGAEVLTDTIAELFKTKERALGYQMIHDNKDEKYRLQQVHERVYRRVADNNNLILINDLNRDHQLDFFPTRKDELAAMINALREMVKNEQILIDNRCKELLGCVRNGIWDKNRQKLAKSRVFGHFDALMALVYLVRNVDKDTNPIPKYFQKNWLTHAGVPVNANEPQTPAAQLARIFNVKTDRDAAREQFVRGNIS